MNKDKWIKTWIINLIDVYLFAAALNCLFQWLARNTAYDLAGFVLSIVCGIIVYIVAVLNKPKKDEYTCLAISVIILTLWFAVFPFVMKMTLNSANVPGLSDNLSQTQNVK